MHLREALLQAADHVEVIVEREIGVQATDDVEFRGALGDALGAALVNLFKRHGVGAGSVG